MLARECRQYAKKPTSQDIIPVAYRRIGFLATSDPQEGC